MQTSSTPSTSVIEVPFNDPYSGRPGCRAVQTAPRNWAVYGTEAPTPTLSVQFDQKGSDWVAQISYGEAIDPRVGANAVEAIAKFLKVTVTSWQASWNGKPNSPCVAS